jgi:hypothetical protein
MSGRNNPNLRDQNDRAVASGVSSTDSVTPVMMRVDPITDYLLVDFAGNSSNNATPRTWNKHDDNDVPTVYGVSDADGVTLVPIRTDSNGYLLVDFA